jgi:hypothetical protein
MKFVENLPKLLNQINVGSPFAVLTSDVSYLKGTTSQKAQKDDVVLLSVEDGTLLSLKETCKTGEGKTPTLVKLEFLDPDGLFISRLFRNQVSNIYKNVFNSVRQVFDEVADYEEGLGDPEQNAEGTDGTYSGPTADDFFLSQLDELSLPIDDNVSLDASGIGRNDIRKVFLGYGMGNDIRQFSGFRAFYIINYVVHQDSRKNGVVTLDLVPSTIAEEPFEVSQPSVDEGSLVEADQTTSVINQSVSVELARIVRRNSRGSGRLRGSQRNFRGTFIAVINNTPSLGSILELLFQRYLRIHYADPSSHIPIVFLKPSFSTLINSKLNTLLEERNNSESAGAPLTDKDEVSSFKLRELEKILNICGLEITWDRNAASISLTTVDGEEQAYAKVFKVIRQLYKQVDITTAMFGSERGDPVTIDNVDLQKLLITHLFEPDESSTQGIVNSDVQRRRNLYVFKQRADVDTFFTLTGREIEELRRTQGTGGLNLFEPHISIQKEVHDFTVDMSALEEGRYNIHLVGDEVILNSAILGTAPNYAALTLSKYHERVVQELRGTNKLTYYTNTQKFLVNYIDYLKKFKELSTYIESSEDAYDLGTNAFSERAQRAIEEGVPILKSGVEDANVFDVIFQQDANTYASLMTTFAPYRSSGYSDLSAIFLNQRESTGEWNDAVFEDFKQILLKRAYKANLPLYTTLEVIANEAGASEESIDAPVLAFYDEVFDRIKTIVANNTGRVGYALDFDGLQAYLTFIQALTNQIATISVKTVPHFNKNFPTTITKPAIFLSHNTPMEYFNTRLSNKGFLSGVYLIFGYEHVISGKDCYTTFQMQRMPLATAALRGIIDNRSE